MGSLILRSPNPLPRNHHRLHPNPNPNSTHPHPRHRSGRPNPSPEATSSKPLVMGQVRILKRGEDLKTFRGRRNDLALSSTRWIGPDPDVVRQHVRVADLYAGAACLPSPPSSDLPFPAALVRGAAGDAVATDLRRLLRI